MTLGPGSLWSLAPWFLQFSLKAEYSIGCDKAWGPVLRFYIVDQGRLL